MAILIDVFLAQVDSMIDAENAVLDDLERYRQIKRAVSRYSRDNPDEDVDDVTGDGGRYYGLATELTNWYEGFSYVLEVEYPAAQIASDETPTYLGPDDWNDNYWAGGTRYLYLPTHAPATTEALRIRYTTPWFWSASSSTMAVSQDAHGLSVDDFVYQDSADDWQGASSEGIATHLVSATADSDNCTVKILQTTTPTEDFFTVCTLAAAYCCRVLAIKFSKASDSTLSVDSSNHRAKADEHAYRANELEERYVQAMGLGGKNDQRDRPASVWIDWDTQPSEGQDWVHHGAATR